MKLKGKMVIELIDVNTSEVETTASQAVNSNLERRRIWTSYEFSLMCQSLFAILGGETNWQVSTRTLNLSNQRGGLDAYFRIWKYK